MEGPPSPARTAEPLWPMVTSQKHALPSRIAPLASPAPRAAPRRCSASGPVQGAAADSRRAGPLASAVIAALAARQLPGPPGLSLSGAATVLADVRAQGRVPPRA